MLKSYKYRLYPTKEQKVFFAKTFGCCRFVYNKTLEAKRETYNKNKINLSCFDIISGFLKDLKNEYSWLYDVSSQALQQEVGHMCWAYKGFFEKRTSFPRFKNKYLKQSYSIPQGVKVNFSKDIIKLPKIKNIAARIDRRFEGKIKTCTVSKTPTDKYFISILVEDGNKLPEKTLGPNYIGIDLGIKTFTTFSDGSKIDNPKFYNKELKHLERLQQLLSNKIKGSNNYNKLKLRIALLHEKICNKRDDFLHKLSSNIINNNHVICLEDLNVKSLLEKSPSVMSRNIGDVSWSKFVAMMKYKAKWYGRTLVQINRFEPSSKRCHVCGKIHQELSLSDREWQCSTCGTLHDRDINAAKNILIKGLETVFGQELSELKSLEIISKGNLCFKTKDSS